MFQKMICFLVLIVFFACETLHKANIKDDIATLKRLQKQQRDAHLTNNAPLFVEMFHDPIIQLRNGSIQKQSREACLERVQPYFERSTFLEWDDIEPPDIRVSQDGSMAYIIVNKSVRLTVTDENGEVHEGHTIFAWLETWEKKKGKWQLMAAASTRRDVEPGE